MHPWCDIASLSTFFPQSGQSTLPFAHNGKCPGMFSRSHLNAQPLGQDTTHLSQSFPCFSASGNFPFQRQPLLAQVTSKLLVNLRMATFIVSSSFPNWWRHSDYSSTTFNSLLCLCAITYCRQFNNPIKIKKSSLNRPITIKVVISCLWAHTCFCVFRRKCLLERALIWTGALSQK